MQNRASTNYYADKVKELFFKDEELTQQHHEFADGKWNHMMSQTHIGYTSWSDPAVNKMPEISYIQTSANPGMGYMLESGTGSPWGSMTSRSFTPFDPINDQKYYVEIYNTSTNPLNYSITTNNEWLKLSSEKGTVEYEEKVYVSIDWDKVPENQQEGEFSISGADQEITITVPLNTDVPSNAAGFIENNGIVSIEAANFQSKNETSGISWEVVPNLGRTASGVTSKPVTAPTQTPGENSPYLEYDIMVLEEGTYNLEAWFSPTLNFQKDEGLMYAFSINNGEAQLMNLHENAIGADWTYPDWWNNAVTDNIMKQTVTQQRLAAGTHTIRYYMADPGLVLQKIILKKEGVNANSYLGPPQSVIK